MRAGRRVAWRALRVALLCRRSAGPDERCPPACRRQQRWAAEALAALRRRSREQLGELRELQSARADAPPSQKATGPAAARVNFRPVRSCSKPVLLLEDEISYEGPVMGTFWRGIDHFAQGRLEEAQQMLKGVTFQYSERHSSSDGEVSTLHRPRWFADAHFNLALISLALLGRLHRSGAAADPTDRVQAERLSAAVEHHARATLQMYPEHVHAEMLTAVSSEQRGKFDEADQHYRRAKKLHPGHLRAHLRHVLLLTNRDAPPLHALATVREAARAALEGAGDGGSAEAEPHLLSEWITVDERVLLLYSAAQLLLRVASVGGTAAGRELGGEALSLLDKAAAVFEGRPRDALHCLTLLLRAETATQLRGDAEGLRDALELATRVLGVDPSNLRGLALQYRLTRDLCARDGTTAEQQVAQLRPIVANLLDHHPLSIAAREALVELATEDGRGPAAQDELWNALSSEGPTEEADAPRPSARMLLLRARQLAAAGRAEEAFAALEHSEAEAQSTQSAPIQEEVSSQSALLRDRLRLLRSYQGPVQGFDLHRESTDQPWGMDASQLLVLARVLPGLPAAAAGLSPGMAVVSVDGHAVNTHQELGLRLRGATTVRIGVVPHRQPEPAMQQQQQQVHATD
eukprot:TRINITY_DN65881_c0_g1_i1.p1 TRINITY_DN65881_c0_g1~~TRINITY_DN65881_c0_g1_i1.p1  ORF type:complete len:659 (+),score=186.16 TRINITY_DN65881_c0_g1_i1:77-1978(+)